MRNFIFSAAIVGLMAAPVSAEPVIWGNEQVDFTMVSKIRDEGFNRSHVMKTLKELTDKIGPRLAGSPAMKQANEWTRDKLTEWGMSNARLEAFDFGRGWTHNSFQVTMTAPRSVQLTAYPVSWHPGTNGDVEGEVVQVNITSEKDFEKYKGKLNGKIAMIGKATDIKVPTNKVFIRRDDKTLAENEVFRVPSGKGRSRNIKSRLKRMKLAAKVDQFMADEGVVATFKGSWRDAFLINATGYNYQVGKTPKMPLVTISREEFNRIDRLIKAGETVTMKMNVDVTFHDNDYNEYNTIAEISGKNKEVVMIGAHLDSWFMGDGAVDNGAGTVVAMEAMRILQTLGVKPKRTIRIGLWGAEEQGLIGSRAYVQQHFADRPMSDDPELADLPDRWKKMNQWPLTTTKEHERFSAYFNLDNGSGKIRGVYAEKNSGAAKLFKSWLEPFHDLGATSVTHNATGGTDHMSFDAVGLPGFQFIQDNLDYGSRLHHTQLDMLDHVVEADLKQAAVIMASFLYNAAMADELMPRKPMPKQDPAEAKKIAAAKAKAGNKGGK
jgi:hypothetical protein